MYKKNENPQRLTVSEAVSLYIDQHFLMELDDVNALDPVGTVLYIGDDSGEFVCLSSRK